MPGAAEVITIPNGHLVDVKIIRAGYKFFFFSPAPSPPPFIFLIKNLQITSHAEFSLILYFGGPFFFLSIYLLILLLVFKILRNS